MCCQHQFLSAPSPSPGTQRKSLYGSSAVLTLGVESLEWELIRGARCFGRPSGPHRAPVAYLIGAELSASSAIQHRMISWTNRRRNRHGEARWRSAPALAIHKRLHAYLMRSQLGHGVPALGNWLRACPYELLFPRSLHSSLCHHSGSSAHFHRSKSTEHPPMTRGAA